MKATKKIDKKTRRERLRFYRTLKFPRGFLWGAATSAHQVEGGNIYNDWWEWEKKSKIKPDSNLACNHYKLFRQDFDLIKKLHQNTYRFSIEWSRFEPKEGQWNFNAVRHYRQMLLELKKREIKSMVTLFHFTLPLWFSKKGGFSKKISLFYFQRFVKFVAQELGDLVDFWLTINEPLVYTTQGYITGVWPPGEKNRWVAFKVYRNLAKAHQIAYQTIYQVAKEKGQKKPKVGFAGNTVSLYSYKPRSLKHQFFILLTNWLWNHSFYFLTGKTHDFLGINYYFHYRLKKFHFRTIRFFTEASSEHREMSSVGWEIYPQGIFDVLIDLRYYNLPIYITENGIATLNEIKRARYIVSYLKEIYHAILAGVNVRGYFYWSFLDNFEWEKGFKPRFGIIEVNFKNFQRKIKYSAKIYSQICKNNSISPRLLRFVGRGVKVKVKK